MWLPLSWFQQKWRNQKSTILRLLRATDARLTADVAYVNGNDLIVTRSRQRYGSLGGGHFRYTDLGLFSGFEADLHVDDRALKCCTTDICSSAWRQGTNHDRVAKRRRRDARRSPSG
jgi:hypothetical protein